MSDRIVVAVAEQEIGRLLGRAQPMFVEGMKLAFIAIHPDNPDGHFVVAAVGLARIAKAIEETRRSRGEADPTEAGSIVVDAIEAAERAAYEAGYRQGWRNGRCDRDEGEDDIGDDPGDSYELWVNGDDSGAPFGGEDDEAGADRCDRCGGVAVAVVAAVPPRALCDACHDAEEVPRG